MLLSVDTMVQCLSYLLALGLALSRLDITSVDSGMKKLSPTKTSETALPEKALLDAERLH